MWRDYAEAAQSGEGEGEGGRGARATSVVFLVPQRNTQCEERRHPPGQRCEPHPTPYIPDSVKTGICTDARAK